MEERNMPAILLVRNDTAQSWEDGNPVLHRGEPGFESNTRKLKFGDGQTPWSDLPYATTPRDKFIHSKNGTVHNLTGPSGAELIYFTATDVYQDGDTWTLNGAAVSVTYHDGQALLPTAVIAGDAVEAAVEGDSVRLMLQKPTPQPNVLINAILDSSHLVNQRGQSNYIAESAVLYGPDMWRLANANAEVQPDGLRAYRPDIGGYGWIDQPMEHLNNYLGKIVTLAVQVDGKTMTSTATIPQNISGYGEYGTIPVSGGDRWIIAVDMNTGILYAKMYIAAGMAYKIQNVKFESGPRFTGWHEPKPGETLAECQRYQLAVNGSHYFSGGVYSARGSTYVIPTPVTMRAKPVLTKWVVKYGAIDSNGNAGGVLTASVTDFSENSIKVDVSVNKDLTLGPSALREATFFFDANL